MARLWRSAAVIPTAVAVLMATVWAQPASSSARASEAAMLRAQGLELGYSLDHDEALRVFRQAIAADPHDPAAYRLAAATLWISTLFEAGAITAEDFLGQAGSSLRRVPQNRELRAALDAALSRVDALAARQGQPASPENVETLYQVGAAHGLLASYTATIDGSLRRSLGPARRAYREHQRVLDLDPRRADAGLIVGMYRYAVSTLPAWSRLLAHVAGFGGGRERGLRLVEEAANHPGDAQANARFTLIVIYNREARYQDALRVIGELQQQFPRNRLLWLEEGCTALRAGLPDRARAALEDGLARLAIDPRPRAFGELARWKYHRGLALARLNQPGQARLVLDEALRVEAHDWVRGRTHLERARLASLSGDAPRASSELELAIRFCNAGEDVPCAREAKALLRRR